MNARFRRLLERIAVVSALLGFQSGCERLPVPAIDPVNVISSSGEPVVSENGRGGYNWKVISGEFVIERPAVFAFTAKVDRDKLAANLQALQQREPLVPGPIEGMDADVYAWVRDYTEPQVVEEPILTIPPAQANSPRSYCLSPRGNLLVTIDSKITMWDVDKKKQVKQLESPVVAPKWIHIDSSNSSMVFGQDDTLYRLSFKDGKLETWKLPNGKIVAFAGARDKASYVLADGRGRMLLLKADFKSHVELGDGKAVGDQIAITPDGAKIFGVVDNSLEGWELDGSGSMKVSQRTTLNSMEFSAESLRLVVGNVDQHLIGANFVFGYRGGQSLLRSVYGNVADTPFRFSCDVLDGYNASNGSEDWVCLLLAEKQEDGSKLFCLRDMSCVNSLYSSPFALGTSKPKSLQVNALATRLAIEDDDSSLRILSRRSWVTGDPTIVARRIAKLVLDGRAEQAERCSSVLRKAFISADRPSGEEVFGQVAEAIGQAWSRLERVPQLEGSKEQLRRLKSWYEQGSVLAEISFACSLTGKADDRYPFAVNRRSEPPTKQLAESREKLLALAAEPDAPVAVLECLIKVCKSTGVPLTTVEELLLKHLESRPTEFGPLAHFCDWVSPKGGGVVGDLPATLDAIASLYPKEIQDDTYGMLVVKTLVIQQEGSLMNVVNVELQRVWQAAQHLVQQKRLRDYEVEALMNAASENALPEWTTYWFKEHRKQWLLPSRSLHDSSHYSIFDNYATYERLPN